MNLPMRSKIFDLFLSKIKEMKTVEAFKGDLQKGSLKIARVNFGNAICLESYLSDTYFQILSSLKKI